MGSGAAGTYSNTAPVWVAVAVAAFVPPTAGLIRLVVQNQYLAGATSDVIAAPSNTYVGPQGASPPPLRTTNAAGTTLQIDLILEGANVYWASGGAGGALQCLGWEDNL
jgi:hypothetical protein